MMSLFEIDAQLFQLINSHWSSPSWDFFFLALRNKYFWLPLYLFIIAFFSLNFGKKGWIVILGLLITAGIADATSARLLKRNIKRTRPCNEVQLEGKVRALVPCRGYSFTSNHATNHMAMSVFLLLVLGRAFPRVRIPLLAWALLVGYAQIYVGIHYPTDILGGWLLGFIIGTLGFELTRWLLKRWANTSFAEHF